MRWQFLQPSQLPSGLVEGSSSLTVAGGSHGFGPEVGQPHHIPFEAPWHLLLGHRLAYLSQCVGALSTGSWREGLGSNRWLKQ